MSTNVTEQGHRPPGASRASRRALLYRTVLGLAVAALIAAWLPFSILYINSLSKQAATVVRASPVTQTGGVRAGQKVRSVAPITTHTSPAVP